MTSVDSRLPGQPSLWQRYRALSFGIKMLIFLIVGVLAGLGLGERVLVVQPIGDLFIRLLVLVALPLVFFNLLAGITNAGDARVLRRLGLRTMAFYLSTMLVALALGLAATHLLQPGVNMPLKGVVSKEFGEVPQIGQLLFGLIPTNVFQSFAAGKVTQVVIFGILLGVTTLFMPTAQRERLASIFSLLAETFRRMVGVVLLMGPIGVGVLAACTVAQYGTKLFGPLFLFILGVWLAQATMGLLYMGLLYGFTRMSPLYFLKKSARLYATAAATCSSLASVSMAFDVAETEFKIPRHVYRFTISLGSQFNKDGTAVMLSGILLFTAQAAGVHLGWETIIAVLLVGLILAEGSGGVPGAGFVIALIFVRAFHLPVEIAMIVGGVYRFFDMSNTVMNIMGDMVGTVIVAHFEPRTEPSMEKAADAETPV